MRRFKGLLLDLDGTVYPYATAHQPAQEGIMNWLQETLGISSSALETAFHQARVMTHSELPGSGAKHHRLLYFQRMLECLGRNDLALANDACDRYWQIFFRHMVKFNWFEMAWIHWQKIQISICWVTDLISNTQIQKLKHLNLLVPHAFLVTSEEVGHEKPHPYIFQVAAGKLQLPFSDLCMIGDDFKKDIQGASRLGIFSFWLGIGQPEEPLPDRVIRFSSFEEIQEYF